MLLVFDLKSLLVTFPAAILASMASSSPRTAGREAYVFGVAILLFDLLLRASNYPKIKAAAAEPVLITRDGPKARPRRPVMEVLETLMTAPAGGQFFWIVPAWLVGALAILGQWNGYFKT